MDSQLSGYSLSNAKTKVWKTIIAKEKEKFGYNTEEDQAILQEKLKTLEKELNRKYRFFKEFLKTKLSSQFFTQGFLYLSSLIEIELLRVKCMVDPEEERLEIQVKGDEMALQDAKNQSSNYLKQFSFTYGKILQNYRFNYDPQKEKLFYETLYYFLYMIAIGRFSNKRLHPIIKEELHRLFRTDHFIQSDHKRKQLKLFVNTRTLYDMKRKAIQLPKANLNIRLPDNRIRSPIMDHALPLPDKERFSGKHPSKRTPKRKQGLHIPPKVLLADADPTIQDKSGHLMI